MSRRGITKSIKTEKAINMPGEKYEYIDLSVSDDCRKFLRNIKVQGISVKAFQRLDDTMITVDEMTDDEAIQYANQMYFDVYGGEDSGGPINTNLGMHSIFYK